jgi:hypothetical protein
VCHRINSNKRNIYHSKMRGCWTWGLGFSWMRSWAGCPSSGEQASSARHRR